MRGLVFTVAMLTLAAPVFSHGGGLDASGCHHDRKRGGYHCHRGSSSPPSITRTPRLSAPVPSSPTRFGLVGTPEPENAQVKVIQRLLLKLGYDPGEPDGHMGAKTRFAIVKFEERAGLAITGEPTDALLEALLKRITE